MHRLIAAFVLVLAAALPAGAQTYPSRYVKLVLPFPPGGGTDTLSRIMGQKLGETLGQQIIIDNRPGAGGNIATDAVAKAPKDGYTLLMGFSTALVVNPSLYPKLPFDIEHDLIPVAEVAEAQYVLTVNPASVPAKSVEELVAYAKAHPKKLNYSSAGVGSPLHLAGELFQSSTGTEIVHIPYKGGGPAVTAVLAGEVDMVFGSVAAVRPYADTGQLRVLAVTGPRRSDAFPDLPTLDQAGLKGFDVSTWYGVFAPTGTPPEIVLKLHDEIGKVLALPEVRQSMAREGLAPINGSADALGQRVRRETATWAKIVKDAGITLN